MRLFSVMNNPVYDMPGTQPEAIDRADPVQIQEACKEANVIYLCLNAHYVDWYEHFPPCLEAAIDGAAATGAKFVYHDNVYMYGPVKGPLTEDLAYTTVTRKGKLRGDMANTVMEAARGFRATLCAASDSSSLMWGKWPSYYTSLISPWSWIIRSSRGLLGPIPLPIKRRSSGRLNGIKRIHYRVRVSSASPICIVTMSKIIRVAKSP